MFALRPDRLEQTAGRAAGWLRRRGLRAGDRVAVAASNHPGYLPLTLGALRTGVVPVLVNHHLPQHERDRILDDAEPALVVTDGNWPALDGEEPIELHPHPIARPMHYTSGTTGTSKGVWSGILDEADAAALVADERELWDPQAGDTFVVVSPLYHSAPHRSAVSALLAGARVLVFESFDTPRVAQALEREKVTGGFFVPTHLRKLVEHGFRAPAVRKALHAGEPCPVEMKEKALDVFPDGTLWEFYGSTEGQFTAISPDEWLAHPGSVGRARPGRELEITDAGPDGVGEVWVTCPAYWRWQYWRDPEKTAQAWRGDKFTAGDLGDLDADGYLYLAGRREDLIITGGVNVYPAEVEKVLDTHPAVADSAVFGVDDPQWGQRVCAAVVMRGEAGASAEDIRQWARERLAGSHAPKDVIAVPKLPRTQTGKVRRMELSRRFRR